MSRIGNSPIEIPEGVTVTQQGNVINVKGKLGELSQDVDSVVLVSIADNIISLTRESEDKEIRSKHGLYRALIANMIKGVSAGHSKKLEFRGVGYRASLKGKQLNLQLGFSHDVNFDIPDSVKISVEKQTIIKISGSDKQEVGMIASKLKSMRPPEPYKGKGIKEQGQYILRKEGKKK